LAWIPALWCRSCGTPVARGRVLRKEVRQGPLPARRTESPRRGAVGLRVQDHESERPSSPATNRAEPRTALHLLLASSSDRVRVARMVDSRLVVHECIEGPPQIATHRRFSPRRRAPGTSRPCSHAGQQYQATWAGGEVGTQHLEEPVEVLNHRGLPRHQVLDHALRLVGRNVVVEPHEFSQDPIQHSDDEGRVLQVRVNPVGQLRGVAVVSDVVYKPECPWECGGAQNRCVSLPAGSRGSWSARRH
jgi:hypothetical protein